jgi:tRNA-dihydrouridine synthase
MESGVDGVMVGTGIFRNPWLFQPGLENASVEDRIRLLKFHIHLYRQTWGKEKDYNILKQFFKIYLNGFPRAAHWRDALMRAGTTDKALSIITEMIQEVEYTSIQNDPE